MTTRVLPQTSEQANPHPDQQCMNCSWWHKGLSDGPTGYCHRYPPKDEGMPLGPITSAGHWCGEWKLHEQPRLIEKRTGATQEYMFVAGKQRTQSFTSRGEANDAEALGNLEWRSLD